MKRYLVSTILAGYVFLAGITRPVFLTIFVIQGRETLETLIIGSIAGLLIALPCFLWMRWSWRRYKETKQTKEEF